jgi:hypothetical protein
MFRALRPSRAAWSRGAEPASNRRSWRLASCESGGRPRLRADWRVPWRTVAPARPLPHLTGEGGARARTRPWRSSETSRSWWSSEQQGRPPPGSLWPSAGQGHAPCRFARRPRPCSGPLEPHQPWRGGAPSSFGWSGRCARPSGSGPPAAGAPRDAAQRRPAPRPIHRAAAGASCARTGPSRPRLRPASAPDSAAWASGPRRSIRSHSWRPSERWFGPPRPVSCP